MATGFKADGVITIGTSVDTAGINEGLGKIEGSFKRIGKLAAAAIGIKAFVNFGKAAISAAADLTEVQNIVDVTFSSMDKLGNIIEDDRYKIENFAKTAVDNYGMSEFAAKQTAGSFAAMGKAMGLTQDQATSMAVELTALTGDFSSFYNISQDYARVAMSAVYTGETETLKRYGIVLTEANLQEYAQSQGIEESVKNMSAREKLILRYNYIQSVTNDIDGDFIRTQDTWANQTRVLSQRWNQFLVVLGNGLTTVLLPLVKILNTLVASLTTWAKAMGEVLAKLFGIQIQDLADNQGSLADSGTDAADAEQDLADATANAADAAKDALGAYDKLNVIQQDTSTSSKGSGDAGGIELDPLDFTTGQSAISAAIDKLKLDINSLYELGQYVGGKITDILNSIPWEKAYEGARKFGTGLADFLNGLISPELFSTVGKTVANSLNTAIYAALSFGQEFDFTNLGLSIAAGVNGFFENFDFNSLGQTIRTWSIGVFNTIKTIITNIDWSQVLKGIFNFLDGLGVDGFMALVGLVSLRVLIKSSILKAFSAGIAKGLDLVPLTTMFNKFGVSVGKAWKNIKWGNIITSHQPLLIISKVLGQMTSAWQAGAKLLFTFGNSPAAQSALNFMSLSMRLFAAIPLQVAGAILVLKEFFDMWENGWSLGNEVIKDFGIILLAVGAIILGVPASIAAVVAAIGAVLTTAVIIVHDHIDEIQASFNKFVEDVKELWEKFKTWISNAWEKFTNWISDKLNDLHKKINGFFDKLKSLLPDSLGWIVDLIKAKVNFILDTIRNIIDTIKNVIGDFVAHIKNTVEDIGNIFKNIIQFLIDLFKGDWKNIWNDALNIFKSFWDLMVDAIKGPVNIIIDVLNGLIHAVENAINLVIRSLNSLSFDVPDWVPGIGGKTFGFDITEVNLPSIPKLAKGAVIPPNKEFMAVLGDQKQGTNIETPLSTMIEAFTAALDARGGSSNNQPIILQLPNGKVIAELVWNEEEKRYKQTGSYRPKYS